MSQQPFVIGVDDPLTTALNNFLKSSLCNGYITMNGRELTFNKNCDIFSPNNRLGPVTCCKKRQEFVEQFNSGLKAIFVSNRVPETERSLTLYGFRCKIKLNYIFDDYNSGSLCIEFADFQEFKKNLGITYTPDSLEFYVDLTYDFFSYSEFGELIDFDVEKKVITPKIIGIFTVDELLMIWSTITAIYVISLLQKDSMLKDYRIDLTQEFKDGITISIPNRFIFVRDMFTFLTLINFYMRGKISNDYQNEHKLEYNGFVNFMTISKEEITNKTTMQEDKPSLFRYLCSLLAISAHKEIFDYNKLIETDWSGNLNDPPEPPKFWDFSWVDYKSPNLPSASIHSPFKLQPVDSSQSVVVTGGSYSRRKHRTSKKSHKIHRRHRRHRHSSHNKKHHTKRHMKRHTKRYRNRK